MALLINYMSGVIVVSYSVLIANNVGNLQNKLNVEAWLLILGCIGLTPAVFIAFGWIKKSKKYTSKKNNRSESKNKEDLIK